MESCFSAVPGVGVVYSINIPVYTWQDNAKQIFSLQCIHSSEHFFLKLRIKGIPCHPLHKRALIKAIQNYCMKQNWRHTMPLNHSSNHHKPGIHVFCSTVASTYTFPPSLPSISLYEFQLCLSYRTWPTCTPTQCNDLALSTVSLMLWMQHILLFLSRLSSSTGVWIDNALYTGCSRSQVPMHMSCITSLPDCVSIRVVTPHFCPLTL